MRFLEKIVRIVINALTIFVFLCIVILLYGKVEMLFSDRTYPNYLGYTLFKVTTGSMGEVVEIDDIILVKITKDVKEQDIITYKENNSFVTHRVIKVNKTFLTTKGDSNNTEDKPILKDAVVGKVVKVFPELGVWQRVFSTPKILVSIFVTLLLFDAAFVYNDKKRYKKLSQTNIIPATDTDITDLTDTQIIKMDNLLKDEKKKRASKKKKTGKQTEQGTMTREEIEEALGKTQILLIQPLGIEDEEKNSPKKRALSSRNREEQVEILTTQTIPVKEIKRAANNTDIEVLETQKIPVEEIKKQAKK